MERLKAGERIIIHDDSGKLPALQTGIQEARLRGEEVPESMIGDILLLEGMHVRSSESAGMQEMQGDASGKEGEHLSGLQKGRAQTERHSLPVLRNDVPSFESPDEVLLDGVQERPSFANDAGNIESELEARKFA